MNTSILHAVGFAIICKNNKASYRLFNMLDQVVGHLYYNFKKSYSLDYYVYKQPDYPISLNVRIHLCGYVITLYGCVLLCWVQLG